MQTIIGRVVSEAKVSEVSGGKKVVNFTIAVNERYRAKATKEMKNAVQYFDCTHWKGEGIAKYLTKGKLVKLEGAIGCNAWTDKSGKIRCGLTLKVFRVEFLAANKPSHTEVSELNGK